MIARANTTLHTGDSKNLLGRYCNVNNFQRQKLAMGRQHQHPRVQLVGMTQSLNYLRHGLVRLEAACFEDEGMVMVFAGFGE
jgi:hypothetical protein